MRGLGGKLSITSPSTSVPDPAFDGDDQLEPDRVTLYPKRVLRYGVPSLMGGTGGADPGGSPLGYFALNRKVPS
jgi:hypothetical protein